MSEFSFVNVQNSNGANLGAARLRKFNLVLGNEKSRSTKLKNEGENEVNASEIAVKRTENGNFIVVINSPIKNPVSAGFVNLFSNMRRVDNYAFFSNGLRDPKSDQAWRYLPTKDSPPSLTIVNIKIISDKEMDSKLEKMIEKLGLSKNKI